MPPGSAASPSGEGLGPAVAPVATTSEQESDENCTPNSGPPGEPISPGLKFSCTIWLAVRVVNALPSDARYAPVIPLAIAAYPEVTMLSPSRPPTTPRPPEIVNV